MVDINEADELKINGVVEGAGQYPKVKSVVGGSVFNLGDLNPGTWFDYDVATGSRVCLRVCGADKLREIRRQTVKKKAEYKKGERFTFDDYIPGGEELNSRLLWDFCIVAWEKFFDANEITIPCNIETKNALMGGSPEFSSFVVDNMRKLAKLDEGEELSDSEKN